MNKITESLLRVVSDFGGTFKGAYNVREDGGCAGRQSSEHIKLESKRMVLASSSAWPPAQRGRRCIFPPA